MLDHIGIYVSDVDRAKAFYTAALAPLEYKVHMEMPEWSVVGFAAPCEGMMRPDFWISKREAAHNTHVAFGAPSKEAVDSFYRSAIAAGGLDNGVPGYRKDYSPGYYAAFVKDADGNNIEAVYHGPSPADAGAKESSKVVIVNN